MEGGEIEFRSRRKDVLRITPKTNELYIFPCWLWHNPIDVKSKQFRLSINMEIIALENIGKYLMKINNYKIESWFSVPILSHYNPEWSENY